MFEIFLSYQGVEASRMVNENLPVKILFRMARSYLETEFYFRLEDDDEMNLVYESHLLARSGTLNDIPIYDRAVILLIYPIHPRYPERSSSQGSSSPPSHPNPFQGSSSSPSHPNPVEGNQNSRLGDVVVELDEFRDQDPSRSLDTRSYDKIRQNFKCPKFSGQARDWKIWDKVSDTIYSTGILPHVMHDSITQVMIGYY